jgi:hypothetical protein
MFKKKVSNIFLNSSLQFGEEANLVYLLTSIGFVTLRPFKKLQAVHAVITEYS